MATGVDETAFLGSAVGAMPIPGDEAKKNDERVKKFTDKRKDTYAVLAPAIKTLQSILAKEVEKESNVTTVMRRAQARVKSDGISTREALADEMLYSKGRLDAFNDISTLFAVVKEGRNE